MASNDDKRIPEWVRFGGFVLTLAASTGGGMFFTVKNVGDPLSDRMIRLEEQNRYIISQQNEIKAAAVDYVAEEVRMELKIRTTVKPECLR